MSSIVSGPKILPKTADRLLRSQHQPTPNLCTTACTSDAASDFVDSPQTFTTGHSLREAKQSAIGSLGR